MDRQRIQYLHDKHLQQTLSAEEQAEWENILAEPGAEAFLQDLIYGTWDSMSSEDKIALTGNRSEEIFTQISGVPQPKKKTLTLWPRIAAAASIVMAIGAGIFYFNHKQATITQNAVVKNDIMPGGNKAFLTLANGKRISLTDAANGNVAQQGGVIITKTSDGQVNYSTEHTSHSDAHAISYNTIETPKGGQYQITLPDGTAVWLNAASSLRYPASFATLAERKVTLQGEAYFEVAKDKAHPFIVSSAGQDVKVLGTHFNINSYSDEPSTKTTLLEGSVQLNNKAILKPGEQATVNTAGINVAEVNTSKVIAWKNGKFIFDEEDIDVIMRKLARWYNVEVVYQEDVQDRNFTASISRFDNISKILDKLSYTNKIHFKIEGRRIIVMR